MSGLTLQDIHEGLATAIRNGLTRDTNVDGFPDGSDAFPQITVHSDTGDYVDYWESFGSVGYSDVYLRVKIEVNAVETESVCIKIMDYLSVGTGNSSSVVDAIRADRTLGGIVDDTFPSSAQWDSDGDPSVAWIPVHVICKKVSAQV